MSDTDLKVVIDVKVTTLDIRGTKVDVFVDRLGYFNGRLTNRQATVSSDTLDGLRKALMKRSKVASARVSVEASLIERSDRGWCAVPIVLTGFHAKDHSILYRTDDPSRPEQVAGRVQYGEVLRRLSAAEAATFLALRKAKDAADAAYKAFVTSQQINARQMVEWAVSEAIQKIGDDDEPLGDTGEEATDD